MTGPSSWDLVAAAQQGDRDAFGQLYTRYKPAITAYLRRRLWDHHEAEDLTSETFLRAWRSIGTVRNQGKDVGAWFTTIAGNLVRDHIKSSRNQRDSHVADAETLTDIGGVPMFMGGDAGIEDVVLGREAAEEVARLVDGLWPSQRTVIRLRFGNGLSPAEIAELTGGTPAAVKATQHRGLTCLRAACGGEAA